ncbi:MAG: hypothetical protein C0459_15200 [Chitinophaga sp.]|jgi:antitoxin component YwqK of YwqJK toxin-antitoxin module|nr:hypothetical protein [Chitinophaga sp.]
MNKFISSSITFLCLFFFSCSNNSHESVVREVVDKIIVNKDTFKTTQIFYPDGKKEEICHYKNNSLHGILIHYDETENIEYTKSYYNGNLYGPFKVYYKDTKKVKSFNYMTDSVNSIYNVEYETSGKLKSEYGTPFVYYFTNDSKNRDTMFIRIGLCNFGFENIKFQVAPDGNLYQEFTDFKNSEIESTKEIKFWKIVKGLKRLSFYMKITCIDSAKVNKIYYDTLTLKRIFNE